MGDRVINAIPPYVKLETSLMSYAFPTEEKELTEHVEIDDNFLKLVKEVRAHRIDMGREIAPAAPLDVNILELVQKICEEDFYKEDYRETTLKLISDSLEYEMLKRHYRELVEKIFA